MQSDRERRICRVSDVDIRSVSTRQWQSESTSVRERWREREREGEGGRGRERERGRERGRERERERGREGERETETERETTIGMFKQLFARNQTNLTDTVSMFRAVQLTAAASPHTQTS